MATGGYRLTACLAFLLVAGTTAAGWQGGRPWDSKTSRTVSLSVAEQTAGRASTTEASPRPRATSDDVAASTPAPSPSARRSCPAAAAACVDLGDHLTWLQSDGRITYGPVRMEPGPPGTQHETPRGTFHVEWKGGANYVSNEYHEPMPYAVFFAPGGVAFHGGSLTTASHGCVHLNIDSARYYHDHLSVGAEVVVF
jgi:hypothetical protein